MSLDPLPRQRLAIEAPPGPVLVIAGPGAGKTFCLIARINQLVEARGVAPERICAVTFTNRAAEEIAIRLKHTLRDRADVITRGTIHALCLSLLREHAEAAGLRKGFGVADEQYQKVVLGRLHVPLEQRGSLLNRFSRHSVQKQDFELTPDDARLYLEYTVWLAHRNMLDFDDLVIKAEQLLRTRGDIADTIAARWDHLLVDEFQDVNAVQYDLLKRLAAPHDNLFAVGDDEQSIFTWTGADPYVLVRFARDYGIERPIVLDKNCRCSRQIFETARRVLAHNPQLFEKQLSADRESPYEVGAFAFRDEAEIGRASCRERGWLGRGYGASRRRHTRCLSDWSSDVCSSDLGSPATTASSDPSSWTRTAAARARFSRPRAAYSRTTPSCSRSSSAPTGNRPTRSGHSRSVTKRRSEERRVGKEGGWDGGTAQAEDGIRDA